MREIVGAIFCAATFDAVAALGPQMSLRAVCPMSRRGWGQYLMLQPCHRQ